MVVMVVPLTVLRAVALKSASPHSEDQAWVLNASYTVRESIL